MACIELLFKAAHMTTKQSLNRCSTLQSSFVEAFCAQSLIHLLYWCTAAHRMQCQMQCMNASCR
jgi:hypothetical protein